MYEDSWYSFVPEETVKRDPSNSGRRRRETLLQQPDSHQTTDRVEPLQNLYEEPDVPIGPPEPTLIPRAKSYTDFYHVVRAQLSKDAARKKKRKVKGRHLDALGVVKPEDSIPTRNIRPSKSLDDQLAEAGQQEYLLYQDQLEMTERHLDRLIADTNDTLGLLTTLANDFRAVETQTSSFQAQCDDLISEEKRLQKLADEVGTDLHYYAYLDGVTRRLNAPGASRLVNHDSFGEILTNLDACIDFMEKHPDYRDAESYLARYQSLLIKALHLLEVGFSAHLDKVSAEISKQILETQSEAARHALAYGRSEEMLLEADGLINNVQRVIRSCYDQFGKSIQGPNFDTYSNTAVGLFSSYSDMRDRDLRPITQQDLDIFKKETKEVNVETACRNFIKQCYERSFSEAGLFSQVFSIDPQYTNDTQSAYEMLKKQNKALVNAANITPVANVLQSGLQGIQLFTLCNLLSSITNEYLLSEYDEEETTQYSVHCHDLTARLLTESLWPFADTEFDAEITKSIAKAPVAVESLNPSSDPDNGPLSNPYPIAKQALDLLAMYDQAIPKERSQNSNSVLFRIITETISALQRAEARLKTNKAPIPDPDPDLFMIKNLLILKNGLVSLEIGDVRSQSAAIQHFGQIWDTLSPQNWIGLFRGALGGTLSLGRWFSATAPTPEAGTKSQPAVVDQDAHQKLDEVLRQSIYALTQRWGTLIISAGRSGKKGSVVTAASMERELDGKLAQAFGNLPEVRAKLREAVSGFVVAGKEVRGV
ncbi:Sec34-like family protein [Xylariaceae sp. FL1019]|nr:Sec34-like family protein [Xylariaceae sp. FL1019]